MSYEDKAFMVRPAAATELWDSARAVAPDPSWPIEKRLHWYQVASHVLLLNCSETVRQDAAREADREVGGVGPRHGA